MDTKRPAHRPKPRFWSPTVTTVVRQVNAFLRGWAGHFCYGNSAFVFDKMQTYAVHRLAIFVVHRHKRSRAWGWRVGAYASPDPLGLFNLDGTVLAPRPNLPWRLPSAGGERCR
ncbi:MULTISPECIES: group II intron maturase-specific domain-containing protein [unclassified Frankia]|uniref:group II intron maturase-specific domain-containing protein n=1 Tax=unclassified Frankia TaxID=2632575 RepID=UPI0040444520